MDISIFSLVEFLLRLILGRDMLVHVWFELSLLFDEDLSLGIILLDNLLDQLIGILAWRELLLILSGRGLHLSRRKIWINGFLLVNFNGRFTISLARSGRLSRCLRHWWAGPSIHRRLFRISGWTWECVKSSWRKPSLRFFHILSNICSSSSSWLSLHFNEQAILINPFRRNLLDRKSRIVTILVILVTHAVIGGLLHVWDLLSIDHGVDDPLETFLAMDHLDNNLSLDTHVMTIDVLFESFITSSDVGDDVASF